MSNDPIIKVTAGFDDSGVALALTRESGAVERVALAGFAGSDLAAHLRRAVREFGEHYRMFRPDERPEAEQ